MPPVLEARYTLRLREGGPVDLIALREYLDEQEALGVPINTALCNLLASGLGGTPTPLHRIQSDVAAILDKLARGLVVATPTLTESTEDDEIAIKVDRMFDNL